MVSPEQIYEYLEWHSRRDRLPEEWVDVQRGQQAVNALTAMITLAEQQGGVRGAAVEIETILSEYASEYRTVE